MTKLTIDTKSFVEAINWVTKNFDAKDEKAYVYFSVNGEGESLLSHLNKGSYFKAPFQTLSTEFDEDQDSLSIPLSGLYLQKIAAILARTEGPIEISRKGSDKNIKIVSSKGRYTVNTIDTTVASAPTFKSVGSVDDNEFFDALQRLSKLCDVKNAGAFPVLETVDLRFDKDNEKIVLMATDRYTIGELTIDFSPESKTKFFDENEHVFLLQSVATLISPSKSLSSPVELVYDEKSKKFGYSFPDGRVSIFSLKDVVPLQYINHKKSVQDAANNEIIVELGDLKQTIADVSSLDPANDIHLTINKDGLEVSDSNNSNAQSVIVDSNKVTKEFKFKFVKSILTESFAPISTEKIKLRFKDTQSAFLFEAVLDNGDVDPNVFVTSLPSSN